MVEALQWSALSLSSSPSFSHGGVMLVGTESWAAYIESSIHHTYYSASVSGQSLTAPYPLSALCTSWLFVKDEHLPVGPHLNALYSLLQTLAPWTSLVSGRLANEVCSPDQHIADFVSIDLKRSILRELFQCPQERGHTVQAHFQPLFFQLINYGHLFKDLFVDGI